VVEESGVLDDGGVSLEQLLEQLTAAPIQDIIGVASPRGVGAVGYDVDKRWMMGFELDAWRIHGCALHTQPLIVRRAVTDDELKSYQDSVQPYNIVRITARVVIDSVFGRPEALLESFVGTDDSDAELNDYGTDLQKPVTFHDPNLGTFTLDRQLDRFEGEANWCWETISLHLSAIEPRKVQEALNTAYSLWKDQWEWQKRIRQFAVQKLLPIKNDFWLEDGERALTAEQFDDRMTLESIDVDADGSFTFWHDDGDLFWGHLIEVRGNLCDGPTDADIPG
jgi:hypothetical protein